MANPALGRGQPTAGHNVPMATRRKAATRRKGPTKRHETAERPKDRAIHPPDNYKARHPPDNQKMIVAQV